MIITGFSQQVNVGVVVVVVGVVVVAISITEFVQSIAEETLA